MEKNLNSCIEILMDMDHIGISIFYFFENADDLRIRMKRDLEFTRRIFNRNDA